MQVTSAIMVDLLVPSTWSLAAASTTLFSDDANSNKSGGVGDVDDALRRCVDTDPASRDTLITGFDLPIVFDVGVTFTLRADTVAMQSLVGRGLVSREREDGDELDDPIFRSVVNKQNRIQACSFRALRALNVFVRHKKKRTRQESEVVARDKTRKRKRKSDRTRFTQTVKGSKRRVKECA
jgi:hypothetical protein